MSKVAIVSRREDELAAELSKLAGIGDWHLCEGILIVSTSRSVSWETRMVADLDTEDDLRWYGPLVICGSPLDHRSEVIGQFCHPARSARQSPDARE